MFGEVRRKETVPCNVKEPAWKKLESYYDKKKVTIIVRFYRF